MLKPFGQIQRNSILNHLLQIRAEKHSINENCCNALSQLFMQMRMVTIKKDKYFSTYYFHLPGLCHKGFVRADIALMQVSDVGVNNNFHFIIESVFKGLLNVLKIHFSHLRSSLTNKTPLPIPISDEVFTLILVPLIKKTVILHSVFTELHLIDLSKNIDVSKSNQCY